MVLDDLPAARWYIGGRDVHRATALLEITITAGTNIVAQKQAFISAAFAELQEQLGHGQPLEEASYVTVREVPAIMGGFPENCRPKRISSTFPNLHQPPRMVLERAWAYP